jgi:hypothetical protein
VHFPDADGLAGEDRTEIDCFLAQTDATAAGDHDGFVGVDSRVPGNPG